MEHKSPEKGSETTSRDLKLEETELTLGLPGESRSAIKLGTKRGFSATVDSKVGRLCSDGNTFSDEKSDDGVSAAAKPPASKVQVVGWPPVKSSMRIAKKSCKFVKVAVDGAPYLRKVDLESYNSYQQLLGALEDMFSCFAIRNYLNEKRLVDPATGTTEYVPTYEDKDGDWMLIGDVPWKMFVETCKRLRLIKSSEAIELASRTPPACTGSST